MISHPKRMLLLLGVMVFVVLFALVFAEAARAAMF